MTYKTILILDTETRTLEPDADSVIEVALTLFDVERVRAIRSASFLVAPHCEDDDVWRKTQRVHGISHALALTGYSRVVASGIIVGWMAAADAVVAHQASFDAGHVRELLLSADVNPDDVPGIPWLDTMHFPWPRQSHRLDQASVAMAHGVVTVDPHRAAPDVDVLRRLIQAADDMGADLIRMLEYAALPRETWVCTGGPSDKDAALELQREHRFRWDRERGVAKREGLTDGEAEEIQATTELDLTRMLEWEAWPLAAARTSYNSPEQAAVKAAGWSWHKESKTWRAKVDPARIKKEGALATIKVGEFDIPVTKVVEAAEEPKTEEVAA